MRDFLEVEKRPVSEMDFADISSEVEGWRVVFALLPREVMEWMARLNDVVRFTKRNYQGSTGVLLGFKMEPTEYTIGLTEAGFDSLHGIRIIEDKVLVIPANMVAYSEFIGDTREFTPDETEEELAARSLG